MALDNIELDNLLAGDDVATDLVATDHYQIVKLAFGAAGTVTDVVSTATTPFPVALSDTDNAVLDTIDAVLDTVNAKLVTGTVIGEVEIGAATFAAGDLGKKVGEVAGATDVGVAAMAIRNDTLADLSGADGDYAPLQVDALGALYTHHKDNVLDSGNSTTTVLTAATATVFTGTGVDVLGFDAVTITMDASHDSPTDGMSFEFSTDNSNWDDAYKFTYTAANGSRRFQFPTTAQYFRVVWTQTGGTDQTHFRMQTILHHGDVMTSVHRLGDNMSPDRSAEVVKSVIYAQAAGSGDYTSLDATAGGNLKVSIEEDGGADLLTNTIHDAAFGTAGTADAQVRSVQGIAGGTALEVDLAGNNDVTVTSGAITETNSTAILADTAAMDTNLATIAGAVSTEMQVDVVAALPAGTNAIGKLAANSGVDIGDVDVLSSALPTGAATAALQDAHATGGMSYHMLGIAAADNDAVIKASAATVYFVSIQSIDATPVYLKLFDLASFTPGTSTADMQFMAPSQGDALGSGLTINFGPHGIQFANGLCALVATGLALDNNTAVSANEVIVTIGYE